MPSTVGLLSPNGNVGSATLRHLITAHKEGKVSLVVLHRPGSPPKAEGLSEIQPPVEVREVALDGEDSKIEEAVKGINVLVSAIAATSAMQQVPLVEAFAKSPDAVTYIPSRYAGMNFSPEERELPSISGFENLLDAGSQKARQLGLGVTVVDSGVFDLFFFAYGVVSTSLQKNQVNASKEQLKHPFPITSLNYLGAAIATLVSTRDPKAIANKTFSAIEVSPTGQEMVELFTKLHGGKPTQVIDYTAEDRQKLLNGDDNVGHVMSVYLRNWQENSWKHGEPIEVNGAKRSTPEELAKPYLA